MADLIASLKAHPPFDEMEPEALRFLGRHLELSYYPRGQAVVGPESGAVERLYIVKQGAVRGSGGAVDVLLGSGECFPLGALIGRRATVYTYRAEKDSFCWELASERFHELLERSARFRAFSTEHLAQLVERSHRALRAEAAESALDGAGMLAPLKSVLRRSAVSCTEDSTLAEAIGRMHAERVGSIVVVDAANLPIGIFTTVDLLQTAAAQAAPEGSITQHMTPRPFALEEEATLADAALAMARHGFRHVVVTRDRLLSVGAVAVRDGRIELADAFEARVRQQAPSGAQNILIHGIGGDAQLAGLPLPEVISDLAAYVSDAIPLAFHAPFDAAVLRRHGFRPRAPWHDLAQLAPALFPGRKAQQLDDWLGEFAIAGHARHDALGDAFATAQLLLVALAEAKRQGIDTVEALRAAQGSRRWLSP